MCPTGHEGSAPRAVCHWQCVLEYSVDCLFTLNCTFHRSGTIRTSNEVVSGNFRAQPVGVVSGNFTSTLTFTAESGTVITCINGDRSMNDSQTVIVQGTGMHICVTFQTFMSLLPLNKA